MRFHAAAFLVCSATLAAQDPAPRMPEDLKVQSGIVFKQVGEKKLDLLLFEPLEKKFEKAPLVVYIHGGGWGGGDKYKILRRDLIEVIRTLNHQGVACASIEYRLADGAPATAFDAVVDCKDAVRFLVKNAAEYGLDPGRVGTFGSSAGGHLTLMTALADDKQFPGDPDLADTEVKIRCVAAYYPLVSFLDPELKQGGNFENPRRMLPLLGGLLEEKRELATLLSPIEHITSDSPAIFVAHGDSDKVLSYSNAERLRDVAGENVVDVECLIVRGADNGFGGDAIEPSVAEVNRRTVDFFVKHLID